MQSNRSDPSCTEVLAHAAQTLHSDLVMNTNTDVVVASNANRSNPRPIDSGSSAVWQAVDANDDTNEADFRQPAEGNAYLGDSGYMSMFSPTYTAQSNDLMVGLNFVPIPLSQTLRACYAEIFNDQCSAFCPVLDDGIMQDPEFGQSLLLQQALALVSSRLQPSLLGGDDPATHYKTARELFHSFTEMNPMASLIAIMLFYWYSTVSPNVLSMDGPWYWTGVAIRQAQEMGLHRRTRRLQHPSLLKYPSLGRRIWWTLFVRGPTLVTSPMLQPTDSTLSQARERLTSMCQGRPCIINVKDCDVPRLTPKDLPNCSPTQAGLFIQWVNLCEIVGKIAKDLRRHPDLSKDCHKLSEALAEWAWNLPKYAQLSYADGFASNYHRDVCQLHLPYLSALTLLDLKRSAAHHDSSPPIVAMLASSCVAKIFENFLVRGSLRFLQGMSGWYITMALLTLLPMRRLPILTAALEGPIHILQVALNDMAQRWPSSKMFENGINTLLSSLTRDGGQSSAPPSFTISIGDKTDASEPQLQRLRGLQQRTERSFNAGTLGSDHVQLSLKVFPGASKQTTPLFDVLLSLTEPVDLPTYTDDFNDVLFDLFENNFDAHTFNIP